MKTLPLSYSSKGFGYNQVKREGMFAVYSQHLNSPRGRLIAYETIIIQSHNGYEIGGAWIMPAESCPPTSAWGRLGWTFSPPNDESLKSALDKMTQVMQSESTAKKPRVKSS